MSQSVQVHSRYGITQFVASNDRPLCVANADFKPGRKDLGGFDMDKFRPFSVPLSKIPGELCKRCERIAKKSSVTLQADGCYSIE